MQTDFPSIPLSQLAGPDHPDSSKTLVLTVNNRYARRILASLSAQLGEHRRVMALPDILPLQAWLLRLGDELAFLPDAGSSAHVLDPFGARSVWQQVITHVESGHPLLDISQAASLAIEADRLMSEWQIVVQPAEETEDYKHFALWQAQYRRQLAKLDAEDGVVNFERVYQALSSRSLKPDVSRLVLAGFTEFTPSLQKLIDLLQGQGVAVYALALDAIKADSIQRVAAPDADTEWRMAAQWAGEKLRAHPHGHYAIVAAQLESSVALAHRVLREALGAEHGQPPLAYNVAAARPLEQWPVARAALAWLQLLAQMLQRRRCASADVGAALLAGYCAGGSGEEDGRARIDAALRSGAVPELALEEFTAQAMQFTPQLGQAWQNCLEHGLAHCAQAQMHVWVSRFKQWLQLLGVPGPGVLDSDAYQTIDAFGALLERLSQQLAIEGELDLADAIAALISVASQTPFQPQRDPGARLDVLGFLEAEGGRWDAVWVLGLTDEVLPAAVRPNPLIPMAALRRVNAPRATPERELQWAQTLFGGLLCIAPEVWLSHPLQEGERELHASPLIAAYPHDDSRNLLQAPLQPAIIEQLQDDYGPALSAQEVSRGGIALIDTQARNPLWAFAKYRLGAGLLGNYAELAEQNVRGLLIHKGMELVYQSLTGLHDLQACSDKGDLPAIIHAALEQAANECLVDYGKVMRRLELERATTILTDWLELERSRAPFTVNAVEQTFNWEHGALRLKLRLDRIDELADGSLVVIDYKTGAGGIDPKHDWMRTRPINLQLPFYASVLMADSASVGALLLVRLHARGIEIKGLTDVDCGLPGPASLDDWADFQHLSWQALMRQWRGVIEQLADEYANGLAANSSLRPDDLAYCDVLPFLRLEMEGEDVA